MQIVIYCSVSNYHRHSGLKQHIFIISVSVGQETRYSLAGSSASQFLIKFRKVFTRAGSHLKAHLGKELLPSSCGCQQFLEKLLMRERKRDRERDRESASKMEVTIFHKVIVEMTFYHLSMLYWLETGHRSYLQSNLNSSKYHKAEELSQSLSMGVLFQVLGIKQ